MEKHPSIFIKNEAIRAALNRGGNSLDGFKINIGSLLDAGNVVAVGESSVEKIFTNSTEFKEWFDEMRENMQEFPTSWCGTLDSDELGVIQVKNFIFRESYIKFVATTMSWGANQTLDLSVDVVLNESNNLNKSLYQSKPTPPTQRGAADPFCLPVVISFTEIYRTEDSVHVEGTWSLKGGIYSFSGSLGVNPGLDGTKTISLGEFVSL